MLRPSGRFWPFLIVAVILTFGRALPAAAQTESTPSASPSATFPVTVTDCAGNPITFTAAPERVVTLDAYAAEFLIDLGLGDRVVGTGFPYPANQIPDDLKEAYAAIPVIAGGMAGDMNALPSREAIAAAKPDLVLTAYSALLGAEAGQINPEDVSAIGAAAFASCSDATSGIVTNIDDTYLFYQQLGQIFGVPERASQLVDAMRARQTAVTARVAGLPPTPIVAIGTDPNDGQPIPTWGGTSITNEIMALAGCQNIFGDVTTPGFFPSVEEIAKRDPRVILVLTDFATDDGDALIAAIRSNPVLAGTSAARDGRFVIVSHVIVGGASPRDIDAVEVLAEACHPTT